MVLPTEHAMRETRDWRTGLAPAPSSLLQQFLEPHAGVRSPYEQECVLNAIARTCLHLLARVEDLEAQLGARMAARATVAPPRAQRLPSPRERHLWNQRVPADGQEPAPASPAQERASTVPGSAGSRELPDVVNEVLASNPSRWWGAKEISVAIEKGDMLGRKVEPNDVSQVLTRMWRSRGWGRRVHPGAGNRRQYSLTASTPAEAQT